MKMYLRLFITGLLMGSADLVPGVSGGTIAFIAGIYNQLIHSIKLVTSQVPALLLRGKIPEAIRIVPWAFLVPLGIGIVGAVLGLSRLMEHLLDNEFVLTMAFFFGLVCASIWIVYQRVAKWTIGAIVGLVVAAALAYWIVSLSPAETPATPVAFFLAGALAICAMILPGISGSFILLIIGKYAQVLSAVNNREIVTLAIFVIGIAVGITLFSRVLSWLFDHYYNATIASLMGFMIGSLAKIWPWKETITTRINSHGIEEPLYQINIAPNESVLLALALAILGAAIILILNRFQLEES
ncbi:MAG: DUF368 domain-containing protein [Caldilineaceae bacterium]|nr:DUF368 domain-containing protein [Caldilineaceae bacterium]MCB9157850.1 DUF368 domain-containing protein [Caldilineaceae bacterium]